MNLRRQAGTSPHRTAIAGAAAAQGRDVRSIAGPGRRATARTSPLGRPVPRQRSAGAVAPGL